MCFYSGKSLEDLGRPEIFNTDQRTQFTSRGFTDVLKDADELISMDGRGRALDNIFIERFWRSVKYEEIYINEYSSVNDLIQALKIYFDFYNTQRPYSSFGTRTPAEVYANCNNLLYN